MKLTSIANLIILFLIITMSAVFETPAVFSGLQSDWVTKIRMADTPGATQDKSFDTLSLYLDAHRHEPSISPYLFWGFSNIRAGVFMEVSGQK